jgi:hypothetical protein
MSSSARAVFFGRPRHRLVMKWITCAFERRLATVERAARSPLVWTNGVRPPELVGEALRARKPKSIITALISLYLRGSVA